MKQKASVILSPETIRAVDEPAGRSSNRSRGVEMAVLEFLERRRRRMRDEFDREILLRTAHELNDEMEETLAFQVELWGEGNSIGPDGPGPGIRSGPESSGWRADRHGSIRGTPPRSVLPCTRGGMVSRLRPVSALGRP